MPRTFKLAFTLAAAVVSLAAVTAQAAPPPPADGPATGIPMCSDSGRACSVDRNCCSGSCVHGNCA